MLDALERKVLSAVKEIHGSPLLVALSGGADSSALLFALHRTGKLHGGQVHALHVNHSLRGKESDRDELSARNLCEFLTVPFYTVKADVARYAKQRGVGLEVAGRDVRYAELVKKAGELGAVVATAHTASDNAETVLFHLSRGAGLDGLCGIPAEIQKNGVTFLRPLLAVSRNDILAYCAEYNIPFVTDSSNLENEFTRNRIRSTVIPSLKEACGFALEDAVFRTTGILNKDKEALDYFIKKELERLRIGSSAESLTLNAAELSLLPRGVSARIIRRSSMDVAGINLTKAQCDGVLSILKHPSAAASVPSPLHVYTENHKLIFSLVSPSAAENFERSLQLGENLLPCGGKITLTKPSQVNSLLTNNAVDCNKIKGNLSARSRKTGDSILLDADAGQKTLKKLFIERKIPQRKRAFIPVICNESDAVVAVCGLGVDIRYKPLESSDNVIIIEFEEQTI